MRFSQKDERKQDKREGVGFNPNLTDFRGKLSLIANVLLHGQVVCLIFK